MKVIILNGSPKAEGNTATALHEVERTLNQQGIETEWIHVGHRQIHGCIACNKCWDTNECCFHDIVNEISEKMDAADGLLIGSPVYFASASGTLLSLLDRLFYSTLHKNWMMKVGASVAIARRGGATATMDVLNKYFLKTNMPCRSIAILEYCPRYRAGRGRSGRGRYADNATVRAQYGFYDQELTSWNGGIWFT